MRAGNETGDFTLLAELLSVDLEFAQSRNGFENR